MTDFSTLSATSVQRAGISTPLSSDSARNQMTGDFQTFLRLLTTQMRNQDPLNPADSTEFVAQLASFSSVEQQVQSNAKLDSLVAAISGQSSDGLAAWIGREVRHPGAADFNGEPLQVQTVLDPRADQAFMVVRDAQGQAVSRFAIGLTNDIAIWTGVQNGGADAPNGRYTFEIEQFSAGQPLGATIGQVFDRVREVRMGDQGIVLVFAEGDGMLAADVTAMR